LEERKENIVKKLTAIQDISQKLDTKPKTSFNVLKGLAKEFNKQYCRNEESIEYDDEDELETSVRDKLRHVIKQKDLADRLSEQAGRDDKTYPGVVRSKCLDVVNTFRGISPK